MRWRAAESGAASRIGVIVNRVKTARLVHQKLADLSNPRDEEPSSDVVLMIGRMRPLDRDRLLAEWESPTCVRPRIERALIARSSSSPRNVWK